MSINDGGAAFPRTGEVVASGDDRDVPGMTLRDYFAAKALPAVMAKTSLSDSDWQIRGMAEHAYKLADAMLKAREVKPTSEEMILVAGVRVRCTKGESDVFVFGMNTTPTQREVYEKLIEFQEILANQYIRLKSIEIESMSEVKP